MGSTPHTLSVLIALRLIPRRNSECESYEALTTVLTECSVLDSDIDLQVSRQSFHS